MALRVRIKGRFSSNLFVDDVILYCVMFTLRLHFISEVSYISPFSYRTQFAMLTDQESYRKKEKEKEEEEREK